MADLNGVGYAAWGTWRAFLCNPGWVFWRRRSLSDVIAVNLDRRDPTVGPIVDLLAILMADDEGLSAGDTTAGMGAIENIMISQGKAQIELLEKILAELQQINQHLAAQASQAQQQR